MGRLSHALERSYQNRAVVPVIVQTRGARFDAVKASLRQLVPIDALQAQFHTFLPRVSPIIEFPLTKWKEIASFNMIGTVLTPRLVEEVAQMTDVEMVYPDSLHYALQVVPVEGRYTDHRGRLFTSTYWTKRMLGLDKANEKGFTGRGVTAAVIDTGARNSHPQLHRVRIQTAMAEKGGSGEDANGHGSWCNATLGGVAARDLRYRVPVDGMAPECTLLSIQALGFIIGMGTTSDILQAMEIAERMGAKVLSMSLGSDEAPPDAENPEAEAINRLVENGIIPCIAAGNSGPDPKTIGSPGTCFNSLTVGSISPFTDEVSKFSSRGPTTGDGFLKPDVSAPGEMVDSALVGLLDQMVDRSQLKYGPISGTSMATPHVAGLVTCMSQLYKEQVGKELTVTEVNRMMEELGHTKSNDDGWGLITWPLVEEWVASQYQVSV